MTAIPAYLAEHGPTPLDELPHDGISASDRLDGVTTFSLSRNARGGASQAIGGHPDAVAYIHGEHERTTVLKAWLEANPRVRERLSPQSLGAKIRQHGLSWHDAATEVLDLGRDEDATGGGATVEDFGECPLCGTELTDHLPSHLPECPER